MMMEYTAHYNNLLCQVQTRLTQLCDQYLPETSSVCRAARYSLLGGGKRVRAVLCMAVCEMLKGDMQAAADFAAAVEMVHCYSLIHDDLPCMDNDDLRRGRPSCHKAFDEATALLAGDALLTTAFQVIGESAAEAQVRAAACAALAAGAGTGGMILGQELDLYHETIPATAGELVEVHREKTGALINAAIQLGAAAAGASVTQCSVLRGYAFDIGLVFQIVDDVLDVTSTTQELGKPVGSDQENNKTTFVTLYGVEAAMEHAQEINRRGCERLQDEFGDAAAFLAAFAQSLLCRVN